MDHAEHALASLPSLMLIMSGRSMTMSRKRTNRMKMLSRRLINAWRIGLTKTVIVRIVDRNMANRTTSAPH